MNEGGGVKLYLRTIMHLVDDNRCDLPFQDSVFAIVVQKVVGTGPLVTVVIELYAHSPLVDLVLSFDLKCSGGKDVVLVVLFERDDAYSGSRTPG